MEEYKIKFYINSKTNKVELIKYLDNLQLKIRLKILKYIEYLRTNNGYLDEPYTKHIINKIKELRIDFGKEKHRIFFFTMIGKKIILLHAFKKDTGKTPTAEINIAIKNYNDVLNNPHLYD
ncbi:MAG: hypothetical protein US58_C0023G0008 [Candidatus Magasanikbacteria bacterium GW2011_GWA2_37_8]|uniref:Phage-related protein n=1 Tax=Candidatus Magasanikbacteria bacterium GW2011_GWA2_37_8 TaxID=1619036 RepID=A0A0G0JTA6_9BACT|nr:MAG: hypothetical protein US58_C0023G0008 [Candidatus Magasanikbacteria bacterium GW2011_GWA2_37_8]